MPLLDRLVEAEVPGRRGLGEDQSGLADFDVLAQLALAGGELRMTELAARALLDRP